MTQFQAEPVADLAPESRTSALAVASLVLSIICCIPGLGAIGALIGVGGVVSISRSNGRLKGMGLAVAGVVIGLLATLAWVIGGLIFVTAFGQVAKFAAPFAAIEAGDRTTLNSWLSPSAQSALTDDQVDAFRQAYQTDFGSYVGVPHSLIDLGSMYASLGQHIPVAQQDAKKNGYTNPIPLPAEFASGSTILIYAADATATGPTNFPAAENIGFVAADGSLVWLIPPTSGGP